MITQAQAETTAFRAAGQAQPRRSDPVAGVHTAITLKDVVAYCLVISLGLILAIHFALFWIYGGVLIYEDNKIILLLETIMSVAIFGFGIERLLSSVGRQHQHLASPARTDQRQHHTHNSERATATIPNDGVGSLRSKSSGEMLRYTPGHAGPGSAGRAYNRYQVSVPEAPARMTALMSTHGASVRPTMRTGEAPFALNLNPIERM